MKSLKESINPQLIEYIENDIFPLYNRNEEAHGINHIKTVIRRSIEIAKGYNVNLNMVYTIAAYHDIGHYIDSAKHEIINMNAVINQADSKFHIIVYIKLRTPSIPNKYIV